MDKKTLLAFLLIAGILMLIPYYYELVGLAPAAEKSEDGLSAPQENKQGSALSGTDTTPSLVSPSEVASSNAPHLSSAYAEAAAFQIETPLYSATISSAGGGTIKSFFLKQYLDSDSQHVQLVQPDINDMNPLIEFTSVTGNSVLLDAPFTLSAGPSHGQVLAITDGKEVVNFLLETPAGIVTKSLTFYASNYIIDVGIDLSTISRSVVSQEQFRVLWRGGPITTEGNKKMIFSILPHTFTKEAKSLNTTESLARLSPLPDRQGGQPCGQSISPLRSSPALPAILARFLR